MLCWRVQTPARFSVDVHCQHTSSTKLASLQSLSKSCFLWKCSNSLTQSSLTKLPFLCQERISEHQNLSDTEKLMLNANVKLFGQILTHLLSQQNQDACINHKNEDKGVQQHPKLRSKNFNLKVSNYPSVDGNSSVPTKLDQINYLGLENVPMAYGF